MWRATQSSVDRTAVHLIEGDPPPFDPAYPRTEFLAQSLSVTLCGRLMYARRADGPDTRVSGPCVRCHRIAEQMKEE